MGFNSKDNKLAPGVWVLVGLREWEVRDINKTKFVDLLEVYNDGEIKNLKKTLKDSIDFSVFKKYTPEEFCSSGNDNNEILFVSEETERYEDMINKDMGNIDLNKSDNEDTYSNNVNSNADETLNEFVEKVVIDVESI